MVDCMLILFIHAEIWKFLSYRMIYFILNSLYHIHIFINFKPQNYIFHILYVQPDKNTTDKYFYFWFYHFVNKPWELMNFRKQIHVMNKQYILRCERYFPFQLKWDCLIENIGNFIIDLWLGKPEIRGYHYWLNSLWTKDKNQGNRKRLSFIKRRCWNVWWKILFKV